jgi:hypothetical protein
MSIIAKRPESSFTPAPEGLHHAVCVDVIDLGLVAGIWGEKPKVRIVWQLDEENPESGRRYEVRKMYTLSLHEKAALRKDLESWRGRKFTEDELGGFDLEKLVGVNCQVQIVHDLSDNGTVWANVQAIVPAPKNVPKLVPADYVRAKDRPSDRHNGAGRHPALDEDPIPF